MEEENSEWLNEWLKENPPFSGPYEFARDNEIERKLANERKERESRESSSEGEIQ